MSVLTRRRKTHGESRHNDYSLLGNNQKHDNHVTKAMTPQGIDDPNKALVKLGKASKIGKVTFIKLFRGCCLFFIMFMILSFNHNLFSSFTTRKKTTTRKQIVFLVGLAGQHNKNNDNAVKNGRSRAVPLLSEWDESDHTLSPYKEAACENPNESFETEECKAIKEWQFQSFPVCNSMHELDISAISQKTVKEGFGGAHVTLWKYKDASTNTTVALRTMRYDAREFDMRTLSKWRIENLALERLTFSLNVMDVYGYCGTVGMYEFSKYPSLAEQIEWQKENGGYPGDIDTTQLLRTAVDAARGLADAHTFDGDYPTLCHGDISYHQFIYVNGVYKLIDFNDGFFLTWNEKRKSLCKSVRRKPHRNGAPEEYEFGERTEKSDVFSFGYVLYGILTGWTAFQGEQDREKISEWVIEGSRSLLPKNILSSKDPVHIALIKAMNCAWEGDPEKRSSAREIANQLAEALDTIEKERNSKDGRRWIGNNWMNIAP